MEEVKLSKRQEQIIEAISSFSKENELPPTVRDIQRICNISSTSVVDYNLKILEKKNLVNRRRDVARGIELNDITGRSSKVNGGKVPILGKIAAGHPLPVYGDVLAGMDEYDTEFIEISGEISAIYFLNAIESRANMFCENAVIVSGLLSPSTSVIVYRSRVDISEL